jgi:hypothetical protein
MGRIALNYGNKTNIRPQKSEFGELLYVLLLELQWWKLLQLLRYDLVSNDRIFHQQFGNILCWRILIELVLLFLDLFAGFASSNVGLDYRNTFNNLFLLLVI